MVRILKITSGLMGVLLLMVVGVMRLSCSDNDSPILIGLEQDQSTQDAQLVFVIPETNQRFPITGKISNLSPIGATTHWLYFVTPTTGLGANSFTGFSIYRIALQGGSPQLIVDRYNPAITKSQLAAIEGMDEKWIVFSRESGGGMNGLFRVRSDGSEQAPIIPTHLRLGAQLRLLEVSDNREWLAFSANDPTGKSVGVFKVRLDGSGLVDLTPHVTVERWLLRQWIPDEDWLVVSGWDGNQSYLFFVNTDSGKAYQFATDVDNTRIQHDRGVWLKTWRLLLIQLVTNETRYHDAVKLSAFQPLRSYSLWELDSSRLIAVSPDEQWLLIAHYENNVYQLEWVRPDLAQYINISNIHSLPFNCQESPDSKWIACISCDDIRCDLWRLGFGSAEAEQVAQVGISPYILGWSPDMEWLVYRETVEDHTFWNIHNIKLNRRYVVDIPYLLAWHPHSNRHWHPSILAAVAVMFIFVPPLISKIRLQQRGRV